jgi:hypothetical protein
VELFLCGEGNETLFTKDFSKQAFFWFDGEQLTEAFTGSAIMTVFHAPMIWMEPTFLWNLYKTRHKKMEKRLASTTLDSTCSSK